MAIGIEVVEGGCKGCRDQERLAFVFEFLEDAGGKETYRADARLCLKCASQHIMDFLKKDMWHERTRFGLEGKVDEDVNWDEVEIAKPFPAGSNEEE